MPAPLTDVATHLRSISASPHLLSVLARLHAEALAEPPHLSGDAESIEAARHKFVALDPDKCAAVYLLLRGAGARVAIEAGTSFGVSTAYLALAVGQNVAAANAAGAADGAGAGGVQGKVIGTELEAHKAAKAREHWRSMGEEVEPWIELREGDLRETLKEDLPPEVDFLLVDIWTPLALPALKLAEPHFKKGTMVIADNVEKSNEGYRDFMAYVSVPANGYRQMTLPFTGGLLLMVYVGKE